MNRYKYFSFEQFPSRLETFISVLAKLLQGLQNFASHVNPSCMGSTKKGGGALPDVR